MLTTVAGWTHHQTASVSEGLAMALGLALSSQLLASTVCAQEYDTEAVAIACVWKEAIRFHGHPMAH